MHTPREVSWKLTRRSHVPICLPTTTTDPSPTMEVPNKQKKELPMKLPFLSSSSSTPHHISNEDKPNGTQSLRNPNSPLNPNTHHHHALSPSTTHHEKNKKVHDKPISCKNPNRLQNPTPPTPTTVLRHSFSSPATSPSSLNLPPLTLSNRNPNSNAVKNPNSNPNPNSNAATRRQLEVVLRRLGGGGEDDEDDIAAMLGGLDGAVDLDELSCLRHGVDDEVEEEEEEEEMRAVFSFFDGNGDGRISAEELREALAALGDGAPCSVEDCRRMIAGVDSVGDGFVCFGDFARMMIDVQRSM